MSGNRKGPNPVSRRNFLKTTVAKGTAGLAVAAAGLHPKEAEAANIKWDRSADVVVVGAGVSGLACACAAVYTPLQREGPEGACACDTRTPNNKSTERAAAACFIPVSLSHSCHDRAHSTISRGSFQAPNHQN